MSETEKVPQRRLFSGNEAAGEAAIRAGCRFYGGYPITPQNELIAYMADQLPQRGGVFVQAESELAAINMLYGAGGAGVRCMTSSSSPGISLKQEGISYLAGSEIPAVIVNISRGGPGLGNIGPSQGDYFQSTRGGGHGDYRCIALGPSTVQEMAEFTTLAFELADKYRIPVIVVGDAMVGQMMEPVEFEKIPRSEPPEKAWALTGAANRERNIVHSFDISQEGLEEFNRKLVKKHERIQEQETRCEKLMCEEATHLIVAYGTCARVAKQVVVNPPQSFKGEIGLFRPITLWPYPYEELKTLAEQVEGILTIEMNAGQMVEDVKLASEGRCPVKLLGYPGGGFPEAGAMIDKLLSEFGA
ncbi:MAG: 3-methyl-2-oxobutanoate dehydrogenase subunit VorB [Candidatus Brocadiia bacterium]